jgi:acetate kinase
MVNSTEDVVKKPKRESHVLALNSGSSSLKFGLYRVSAGSTLRVIVGDREEQERVPRQGRASAYLAARANAHSQPT